jgi:hypothetical protein
MADVTCDWRQVRLVADGPDRVRVSGARGGPPTTTYKVTATSVLGYRALTTAMFAGVDAVGKARRMAAAVIARTELLLGRGGFGPLAESSVEVVGAGDIVGGWEDGSAPEVVVKIGLRHADRAALEIFAAEFASMALVAQGMTGVFAGRPRVAPAIAVHHLLVDKTIVPVRVFVGSEVIDVEISAGDPGSVTETPQLIDPDDTDDASDTVTVPLRALAYGRSGDKGNLANIGLIARRPEFVPVLRDQVGAARVAGHFAHVLSGSVRRWSLPGLGAVNIVLDEVLGGIGGTSTLRYDPQGKSYAAMLLRLPVQAPRRWLTDGLVDGGRELAEEPA